MGKAIVNAAPAGRGPGNDYCPSYVAHDVKTSFVLLSRETEELYRGSGKDWREEDLRRGSRIITGKKQQKDCFTEGMPRGQPEGFGWLGWWDKGYWSSY